MSRRAAMQFLEPTKVAAMLPLLERNLAKIDVHRAGAPAAKASVAAVFRWREREQRTLELLFVRRSINERDTWSGQVAFPGGKRQHIDVALGANEGGDVDGFENDSGARWESPRETAQRETMEEIGLDLSTPNVRWIGSLPAIQTHLRTFWVSTQVYVIETPADELDVQFTIQTSEIADVFWVDIQELYNPTRYQPLVWPIEELIRPLVGRPRLKRAVQTLFGDLVFSCVYLPRPDKPVPDVDVTAPRHPFDFILWGLTLRMISDLCRVAKTPLPVDDVMPHFTQRFFGDAALFLYRHPDKALARAATITALAAAVSLGVSRL